MSVQLCSLVAPVERCKLALADENGRLGGVLAASKAGLEREIQFDATRRRVRAEACVSVSLSLALRPLTSGPDSALFG